MNTQFAYLSGLITGVDQSLWSVLLAAFAAAVAAVAALGGVLRRREPFTTASGQVVQPARALPSLWWRLAWPLIAMLEVPAARSLGVAQKLALAARLQQAGLAGALTPAQHRAGVWVGGLVGAGAGSLFGQALGTAAVPLLAGLGLAAGAAVPLARLRDRIAARRRALLRQLPFYLDLITLSVESGMNLGSAIGQAVDRGPPGPVRDELAALLRDLRAGRSRQEALRAMAERTQMAAVSNLSAALATAQKQGASLGPILRAQAEQRRSERFLKAERLAMEAPVKMLLPLSLFIFPGTFAVLLFPVLTRLVGEGVL